MALITDGRFSGATHGFMVAHVTPEAALGGPLAAVRDGDVITLDVDARRIDVDVSEAELARRLQGWAPPAPRYPYGALAKYAATVGARRRAGRSPRRCPRRRRPGVEARS